MSRTQGKQPLDGGFTLVELLVVVLVIGILAAIAVPVFLGVQNGAINTTTVNDLTNAKHSLVAYAAENDGQFTSSTEDLRKYGFTTSPGVEFSDIDIIVGGTGFCIEAAAATGTWFSVTEGSGVTQSGCV